MQNNGEREATIRKKKNRIKSNQIKRNKKFQRRSRIVRCQQGIPHAHREKVDLSRERSGKESNGIGDDRERAARASNKQHHQVPVFLFFFFFLNYLFLAFGCPFSFSSRMIIACFAGIFAFVCRVWLYCVAFLILQGGGWKRAFHFV